MKVTRVICLCATLALAHGSSTDGQGDAARKSSRRRLMGLVPLHAHAHPAHVNAFLEWLRHFLEKTHHWLESGPEKLFHHNVKDWAFEKHAHYVHQREYIFTHLRDLRVMDPDSKNLKPEYYTKSQYFPGVRKSDFSKFSFWSQPKNVSIFYHQEKDAKLSQGDEVKIIAGPNSGEFARVLEDDGGVVLCMPVRKDESVEPLRIRKVQLQVRELDASKISPAKWTTGLVNPELEHEEKLANPLVPEQVNSLPMEWKMLTIVFSNANKTQEVTDGLWLSRNFEIETIYKSNMNIDHWILYPNGKAAVEEEAHGRLHPSVAPRRICNVPGRQNAWNLVTALLALKGSYFSREFGFFENLE